MDWKGLRNHLLAKHPQDAQRCARVDHALRSAEEALSLLTGLGYVFHLEEGPGEKFPEFPCMMFHVDAAPNGRLVHCQEEVEELGPGWFRTLIESQLWDGTQTQFAGRGGVKRQSLPAVQRPPTLEEVMEFRKQVEEAKKKLIEEFKSGRMAA